MPNVFASNLWLETAAGTRRIKDLAFTVPPASSGNFKFTFTLADGVSISSVAPPSGTTWNAGTNTLTVGSGFSGTRWVRLNLAGPALVAKTSLSISLSGTAQVGSDTTVTVDKWGWLSVGTLGSNVTMRGVSVTVEQIPNPKGQVRLGYPLLRIPKLSGGGNDFSFKVNPGSGLSGGTLALSSTSGDVDFDHVNKIVTAKSSLTGDATVIATYTKGTIVTTGKFILHRLNVNNGNGGQSTLNLNSDLSFTVTELASKVSLRGVGIQYETTQVDDYTLAFETYSTNGFEFNEMPVVFLPSPHPAFSIEVLDVAKKYVHLKAHNTNTTKTSTDFVLVTNKGTLDPTIINNPDT